MTKHECEGDGDEGHAICMAQSISSTHIAQPNSEQLKLDLL